MMKWKLPPRIKVYEALGCIADKRIKIRGNEVKVFSSSKSKFYTVHYDGKNAIMCNDNGSYWMGYLGYPAIAFLMLKGRIKYSVQLAQAVKNIKWKVVNEQFKNDYAKTEAYVLDVATKRGVAAEKLQKEVDRILQQIKALHVDVLGKKTRPPSVA